MKFYKDNLANIFAFEEDGSQDHFIQNKIAISFDEANEIISSNQQKKFEMLDYAEKRQAEYPSIYDYLDGIVKGDQEQVAKYIAACQAVKEKYPKLK